MTFRVEKKNPIFNRVDFIQAKYHFNIFLWQKLYTTFMQKSEKQLGEWGNDKTMLYWNAFYSRKKEPLPLKVSDALDDFHLTTGSIPNIIQTRILSACYIPTLPVSMVHNILSKNSIYNCLHHIQVKFWNSHINI